MNRLATIPTNAAKITGYGNKPRSSGLLLIGSFNGFCKAVLRNEAIDAIRERKYRKKHEVTFSDLSPQEENQLYT